MLELRTESAEISHNDDGVDAGWRSGDRLKFEGNQRERLRHPQAIYLRQPGLQNT